MNHLLIFAHPTTNSFNGTILKTIENHLKMLGQNVQIRNLYHPLFQPVLTSQEMAGNKLGRFKGDVKIEHQFINQADYLYFIYPTWWYAAPAILKGYFDRILCSGYAFQSTPDGPVPLLTAKKAIVIETAGDTEASLTARGLKETMVKTIDKGILAYCGIEVIHHSILSGIHDESDDKRQFQLQMIIDTVSSICLAGKG
ncbi:NAD(P)H-dependent oxidoreductase [Bacillus sp. 1P06AnD]|uniref:NAD(P)H-dependent oxidoreductase n=1 Tax=Bacillus sp. 1P06AnD TaxID=3132208 RepID=UPI00399F8F15